MTKRTDVIIVGAGHAGLCASYFLKQKGIDHIVLERGEIGESWLSQRWDSFVLNTANKLNVLPGIESKDPDDFGSAISLARTMSDFVAINRLPVETGVNVIKVEKTAGAGTFSVAVDFEGIKRTYESHHLIIASGTQNKKVTSPLSRNINPHIFQLHSCEYRNPAVLPEGAVLVVGSGQSGCQIAEDLLDFGRKVYLSTSMVPRFPRFYRGKDIVDWLILSGFFELKTEEVTDPAVFNSKTPLAKGTDGGKKSLSLQALAKKGVVLVGKMIEMSDDCAHFSCDVEEKLHFADNFSKNLKNLIDNFITEKNLAAPPPVYDMEDEPYKKGEVDCSLNVIDFNKLQISTIIWATGFTTDFSYLHLPALNDKGQPVHRQGISDIEGLYFLGVPWLRNRKSGILFGIREDAHSIVEKIYSLTTKNLASF